MTHRGVSEPKEDPQSAQSLVPAIQSITDLLAMSCVRVENNSREGHN